MATDNLTRRNILMTSLILPLATSGATVGATMVSQASAAQLPEGRMLVAYFSRSGNTRVVAGQVSRALQADLFEMMPATPYPADYFETVEQARDETDRGYAPPLKARVPDIAAYTTIFLGFPVWETTAPPIVRSFLAAHDLSGNVLIPLVTHGGYGLGNSLTVVSEHASNAQLVEGFTLQGPQERQTIEEITEWLDGLSVAK
ncbi:flavodoxin [Brucella anthropi]|uniref:flavodoxin n=1 Tax=Brucella anthropi TaxID=529 RepID=UPI00124D42EC|nr:flavodoxin [Brucella anthropi]KAB2787203.1 flavodoxin [Brucella anthropi]QOD66543.1 flavodoxin [Ochrobactrum sp. MT180101]